MIGPSPSGGAWLTGQARRLDSRRPEGRPSGRWSRRFPVGGRWSSTRANGRAPAGMATTDCTALGDDDRRSIRLQRRCTTASCRPREPSSASRSADRGGTQTSASRRSWPPLAMPVAQIWATRGRRARLLRTEIVIHVGQGADGVDPNAMAPSASCGDGGQSAARTTILNRRRPVLGDSTSPTPVVGGRTDRPDPRVAGPDRPGPAVLTRVAVIDRHHQRSTVGRRRSNRTPPAGFHTATGCRSRLRIATP